MVASFSKPTISKVVTELRNAVFWLDETVLAGLSNTITNNTISDP